MNAQIREQARQLGFDDCRITTADPPRSSAAFVDWIQTRQHGEMGYLERTAPKRIDPQRVLPGAKSVVVVAGSYFVAGHDEPPPGSSAAPEGIIARYARFPDYHDVLGDRLSQLSQFIDTRGGPGTRSLAYVDTGPVLERDLAQRAGLGFIGKHTNLISRHLGNWIFLGEILTTLELAPDPAEVNRCGSCARCLAACPTGAITAPFQLDARRCISYLTIELRGPIPVEFRRAIGNRIYGCDDCLAVCPWNRFARESRLLREQHRAELATTDLCALLDELLTLDDAGFKRRFAGLPLLRAKRRGLARNVCVALGNCGDTQALEVLARAALDPDPLIAEHAQWAEKQLRDG